MKTIAIIGRWKFESTESTYREFIDKEAEKQCINLTDAALDILEKHPLEIVEATLNVLLIDQKIDISDLLLPAVIQLKPIKNHKPKHIIKQDFRYRQQSHNKKR